MCCGKYYHKIINFIVTIIGFFTSLILFSQESKLHLQGHRGARGNYPENSIQGFIHAIDCGVNTIEMDIVISKDLQVVVSHEPWISCKICLDANGADIPCDKQMAYNIFEMDYRHIKQFDCGSKFHPDFPDQKKLPAYKPLLAEVFSEVEKYISEQQRHLVKYNIEIKSRKEWLGFFQPEVSVMCDLLVNLIHEFDLKDRITIQSFDPEVLRYLKNSEFSLSFLYENNITVSEILATLGFIPGILSPQFKLVNKQLVDEASLYDSKIIPWTVNNQIDFDYLYSIGCQDIITDFPCEIDKR
jgi:glycerophosphoryl diester phosphodiesterase